MRKFPAFLLLFLASTGAFAAGKPSAQLRAVEQEMARQKALEQEMKRNEGAVRKEMDGLRRDMVKLAGNMRVRENEASRLEDEIGILTRRQNAAERRLAAGRAGQEKLAISLVRLGRLPPEVAFAGPGDADGMIKSAIILRGVLPELERQALAVADELSEIGKARAAIDERRKALEPVMEDIASRRKELEVLAGKRERSYGLLGERRKAAQAAQEKLSRQVKDLRDLMARLENERKARQKKAAGQKQRKTAPPAPMPPAVQPVAGKVIRFFGDKDSFGVSQQGISISAPAEGMVVAPMAGRVVFAGPFRSYKHLLIIEGMGGYHALLAGLARIDAHVGEDVSRGEPVGVMGGAGGPVAPELYFELRKDGDPVDPAWVLAAAGKRQK